MRVVDSHSHLNGREHLLVHGPDMWSEIERALCAVAHNQSSPAALRTGIVRSLIRLGWRGIAAAHGHSTDGLAPCADLIKNRVAVAVQVDQQPSLGLELFGRHMALFAADIIDVGVELLPMKELQSEMSSGVAYYEGELYNLIRQGRGVPAVPLVVMGLAP